MILTDPQWEIKKMFRDATSLVIYRQKKTSEALKLKEFFDDYYKVSLIFGKEKIPPCDILCVTLEDKNITGGKWLWVESKEIETKVENKTFFGNLKKSYIDLFLHSCSG